MERKATSECRSIISLRNKPPLSSEVLISFSRKMFLLKFAFLNIVFWLSVFNFGYVESEDSSGFEPSPTVGGCIINCTDCPYPCHPLPPTPPSPASGYPSYGAPPPPVSGHPLYGAPPPPSLPPPVSGFPIYGAPPSHPPPVSDYPSYKPPPSPVSGGSSCGAPSPPFQSDSPPVPCDQYPPPNPYQYVPYDDYSASSPLYFSFVPLMITLFFLAVLL